MILKSVLNAKNKITGIGGLGVPILRYNFGIINWRLEKSEQKTGKILPIYTVYTVRHQTADTVRLYVKRKCGGEACNRMKRSYKAEILKIAEYLNTKYEYKNSSI
jgi:hypothetical protein